MPRVRHYLEEDVLTVARKRIKHVFEVFDSVVVMFSGGKDSLVTLHLVKEHCEKLGIKRVNVVFRDEELIPMSVINFVDKYFHLPWVNMLYYAVPLRSKKFILGQTSEYIQWDPDREHMRKPPPYAITLQPGDDRVFDQYTMDGLVAEQFRGRVAIVTGVRADESMTRYRSVVNKLNENYITKPAAYSSFAAPNNVRMVKPIYDWSEDDIFKWLHENEVEYCPLYDAQLFGRHALRVATPLQSEGARQLGKLKVIDPVFYDQMMKLFPEMLVQERYYHEIDRKALKDKYSASLDALHDWIMENIEPGRPRKFAIQRYQQAVGLHKHDPEHYTLPKLFNAFYTGAYKRGFVL